MRCCLAVFAVLSSLPSLVGQSVDRNLFRKWDRTTEFTSRSVLGPSAGFLSQAFAYGFSAGLRTLTRTEYVIQDQDLSTREPWDAGTAPLDATTCLPAYARLRPYATNLMLPAGTGIGAFRVTHTSLAQNPHVIPDTCSEWHHVWAIKQRANWTTDGISFHMSQGLPFNNTLLCSGGAHRELPRIEGGQIVEELGWSSTPGVNKDPAPRNRAWRLDLGFDEVVLDGAVDNVVYNNPPCPNPNAGYASLDPDLNDTGAGTPARFDSYHWILNAGSRFANGVAVLFWSTKMLPTPVKTPFGTIYLDPNDILVAVSPVVFPPLSATGSAVFNGSYGPPKNPLRSLSAMLPCWAAQAVVFDRSGGAAISSLLAFRPQLRPAGYTAAAATSAGKLVPYTNRKTLSVRNDGRGALTVRVEDASGRTLSTTTVCERACVRIALAAAGVRARFAGGCATQGTRFIYAFDK